MTLRCTRGSCTATSPTRCSTTLAVPSGGWRGVSVQATPAPTPRNWRTGFGSMRWRRSVNCSCEAALEMRPIIIAERLLAPSGRRRARAAASHNAPGLGRRPPPQTAGLRSRCWWCFGSSCSRLQARRIRRSGRRCRPEADRRVHTEQHRGRRALNVEMAWPRGRRTAEPAAPEAPAPLLMRPGPGPVRPSLHGARGPPARPQGADPPCPHLAALASGTRGVPLPPTRPPSLAAACPPAPPQPLTQQLAVLTRLTEDNHQLIRRLTHDLDQVTRRNALLIQQLRPGARGTMNRLPDEAAPPCRFCGDPVHGRPVGI